MNKHQFLGQFREVLTAIGTVIAVWGVNDGNDWAPLTGVIVAFVSLTWGILHHKDPASPGRISWSMLRKFANVLGSAAVTYGFLNSEKVIGIEMLIATLGPLLAGWFSWIDNSPPATNDDDGSPFGGLPLIGLLCVLSLLLPSCGATLQLSTPWGDASTDAQGNLIIAPKPTRWIIPTK